MGVWIHQGDRAAVGPDGAALGVDSKGQGCWQNVGLRTLRGSDAEEAGVSVRLPHQAETSPAVWTEKLV